VVASSFDKQSIVVACYYKKMPEGNYLPEGRILSPLLGNRIPVVFYAI